MLTRWNPVRDMIAMNNLMDRLMEGNAGRTESVEWSLPLDVVETKDEYLVKASIPGVNPDDIEISFQNSVLTIRGSYVEDKRTDESSYHLRERRWGTFGRSLTLPSDIKPDDIQANCENGVLTLHLPKVEEVKPRRIAVQGSKTVDGNGKDAR